MIDAAPVHNSERSHYMKLERIKCKALDNVRGLCQSKSYIIGCTGPKVIIMDRQMNIVHTVDKLDYVYSADVSPDETKLLLVSNSNKFYIVDLQTFHVERVTVRKPFRCDEGKGCWSLDGKSVFIPVIDSTVNSTLRRYYVDDLKHYEEHLADIYWINSINRIKGRVTLFMTGLKRKEETSEHYFIYFENGDVREYRVEEDLLGPKAMVDAEKEIVTVSSSNSVARFSLDGKKINDIPLSFLKEQSFCFRDFVSDSLSYMQKYAAEAEEYIPEAQAYISADIEGEAVRFPEIVNKYEPSSCGNYIYWATQGGFYVQDAGTENVLAHMPEEFGALDCLEISPGLVFVSTFDGGKLYRINDA